MTHPFDSEAIEAAARAARDRPGNKPDYDTVVEGLRQEYRDVAKAALTAAWASLVERGLAPKPEEPWETRERPTIDELEKMLTQDDEREIEILPNGQIKTRKASGKAKPLTMKENLGGEYSRLPHTEG